MNNEQTSEPLDLIWGASAIAAALKTNERKVYFLLENGLLPARKIGRQWVARRSAIEAMFAEVSAS